MGRKRHEGLHMTEWWHFVLVGGIGYILGEFSGSFAKGRGRNGFLLGAFATLFAIFSL